MGTFPSKFESSEQLEAGTPLCNRKRKFEFVEPLVPPFDVKKARLCLHDCIQPLSTSSEVYCIVCGLDDEEVTVVCANCDRIYHLDCHYPHLYRDVGELDEFHCRVCSNDSPIEAYGKRGAAFINIEICERILLSISLFRNFRYYFGNLDGIKRKLESGAFSHAMDLAKELGVLLEETPWEFEKKDVGSKALKHATTTLSNQILLV